LLPYLAQGLGSANRPHDGIERMIEMKVSFDTDASRALEDTRFWAALALGQDEKLSVEDPLQMEQLAAALPIERIASRWIVSSDPHEQVERIRPYIGLGFNHLVFHAPGADQERFLRLYAAEVLPLLRKAFA
jgi:coenzyme F420-dependent glucose-6-phosphate dehydrogenase